MAASGIVARRNRVCSETLLTQARLALRLVKEPAVPTPTKLVLAAAAL